MELVYTPGCWDLLHYGHMQFIANAAELGDRLIVGVASDEVITLDKGRPPVLTLDERMTSLLGLWSPDLVIPYYDLEFLTHLRMFVPNVMVVGEGWGTEERHTEALRWANENDCRVVMLPRTQGISTSEICRRVKSL